MIDVERGWHRKKMRQDKKENDDKGGQLIALIKHVYSFKRLYALDSHSKTHNDCNFPVIMKTPLFACNEETPSLNPICTQIKSLKHASLETFTPEFKLIS